MRSPINRREFCSAALVGLGHAQIEQADCVHHEMHQVVFRHPVSEVRRKEQGSIVVNGDEARGHQNIYSIDTQMYITFFLFLFLPDRLSPTGC